MLAPLLALALASTSSVSAAPRLLPRWKENNWGALFGSWKDGAQMATYGGGPKLTGNTKLVVVGGEAGLVYDPPVTFADPGDRIVFEFRFKNHTVTQSAFDTPCSPLQDGFKSGFMPVDQAVTTQFPGFIITVKDTKPIWFYCGQQAPQPHCPAGMVGAVNPPPDGNTFDAFKAKATALASGGGGGGGSSGGGSSGGDKGGSGSGSGGDGSSGGGSTGGGGGGGAQTHTIKVGGAAGLVYDPPFVDAKVGDKVVFKFDTKNHTVTQSAFDAPCSPLKDGFKSGFKPVDDATSKSGNLPTFEVTVKDDKPIWFYCGQQAPQPHCPQGMVGAINPPKKGNTFDAFKTRALAIAQGDEIAKKFGKRCNPIGTDQKIPANQKNITGNPTIGFLTHGIGTQNYTCDGKTSKFAKNQAVAKLVDTSCLRSDPVFNWISPIMVQLDPNDPFGSGKKVKESMKGVDPSHVDIVSALISHPTFDIGRHMFVPFPDATSTTANPKFDLSLGTGNPGDFIIANLTGSIDSPDGAQQNIRWLQLKKLAGDIGEPMYRLQTAGGQPPTSCGADGEQIFVPYAARYDFTSQFI